MKGRPSEIVAPEHYRNAVGRRWGGDRVRGKITVSAHAMPLIRELFGHLNLQRTTVQECAERSGVHVHAMQGWRTKTKPHFESFVAAANALDLEVVLVPRGTVLPAHARQAQQEALAAAIYREHRPWGHGKGSA